MMPEGLFSSEDVLINICVYKKYMIYIYICICIYTYKYRNHNHPEVQSGTLKLNELCDLF